ncbi:MAG: hypothetical protein IT379_43045 [Deltaproteobacteria bacterium]|nr:hypothetical protein [Deltaproteobacteria bacterium]
MELEQADRTTRVPLPGAPEQVLLLPDGRLVVTRRAASRLGAIDPASLRTTHDIELGIEPYGLALSPDGSELYVTDVQSRRLFVLDPSDLTTRWVAPLRDDDARGIVVSADGQSSYVAHLRAPRVSVVDLRRRALVVASIPERSALGSSALGTAAARSTRHHPSPERSRSCRSGVARDVRRRNGSTCSIPPTSDSTRAATLGCPLCHDPGLGYQDGRRYSMLGTAEDPGEPLDVPSLRSLRLGAPYLHDGRARDLTAVLDGGSMGTLVAGLPSRDRDALVAFLESL